MEPIIKEPCGMYTVRFQDCDPMGHLNNARFIDYILNAREDHLLNHYNISLQDYLQRGFAWVVATHEIVYLKPCLYNEKILIQTALNQFGETDLLVEGLMMNADKTQIKALLWTRYVFVNIKTSKREVHPPGLMKFFESVVSNEIGFRKLQDRLQHLQSTFRKEALRK